MKTLIEDREESGAYVILYQQKVWFQKAFKLLEVKKVNQTSALQPMQISIEVVFIHHFYTLKKTWKIPTRRNFNLLFWNLLDP